MTEHVHEWRWTDVHRSHLVREMKWKCVHCPAMLPIAEAENRLNATSRLSADDARVIAGGCETEWNPQLYPNESEAANMLHAYADILEGK